MSNHKYFVFRNYTVEHLFPSFAKFSAYDDISFFDSQSDYLIWFYIQPIKIEPTIICDEISDIYNKLELVVRQIPSNKIFIIFTMENICSPKYYEADFSIADAINEYNRKIKILADRYTNLKIIELRSFIWRHSSEIIDWKYFYISQIVINPKLAAVFKKWFDSQLKAIDSIRKKCLIVDLDNTMWGGVLGEDGVYGIKLGNSYPGNAFLDFQRSLLELSKVGVILVVCSKNNESDVLEVWEKNPNMILKKDNYSIYKINWNDKASNIREIASELNIGLDSMVFIDDSPTERELIKKMLPEVKVPDFPTNPYELKEFSTRLYEDYFLIYKPTIEDRNKSEMYQANMQRSKLKENISNYEDYLKQLDITISIHSANESNIARIAQMTQKTNQFNLTTHRYTEQEILTFIKKGSYVFCFSVLDRFGNNGITAAVIIHKGDSGIANIDTFLLSCRILGKRIEEVILSMVANYLFHKNIKTIYAEYIPTNKNIQTENFYEKCGFKLLENKDGIKKYKLEMIGLLPIKEYYKIIGL